MEQRIVNLLFACLLWRLWQKRGPENSLNR